MVRTLITTEHLPVADRFAYFRDIVFREPSPMAVHCDRPADFSAQLDKADLGAVTMVSLSTRTPGRCRIHRSAELIRRSDPEAYRLVLKLGGTSVLDHNDHQVTLGPGDMVLYDTSLPALGWRGSGDDRWVMVRFPRHLLPLPVPAVQRLVGARFCGHTGIGALLSGFVARAAQDIGHYRPADAVRLSTTLLDLLGALLAHELETGSALPPESHRQVLLHRTQVFIQQRLGDPALSPATVAAAHHISARSLHRLFHAHGLTVVGWIRARRLERCRRDLADPLLAARPVHAIAARWGLTDAAHFSRIFKSAYGLSPQAYRHSALVQAADAGTAGGG
ncbi:helix-turn-helix domain-containing protein [Actinomadura scrupuli]|uniref:AraC-like ligand-binding domain-containing protein n=1 Tax=Actinomadura scrupuli TaxID=559629 RepID=UPI003D95BC1D